MPGKAAGAGRTLRLLSWNVNGLRAVARKGFLDWLAAEQPDILGLQETKAQPDQLPPELHAIPGYQAFFRSGERPGYSGVALYTRIPPRSVTPGIGLPRFDNEGRIIVADFGAFVLANVYFPNGNNGPERLQYKLDFYAAFLAWADAQVASGRQVLFCGDVNTAHREIDLARPRENQNVSGFLPVERAWIDQVLEHGWLDTFRLFNAEPGQYSWWDVKTRARDRNVGWRLDYFFINQAFRDRIVNAFILPQVMGSDHCPVGVEIQ